MPKNGGFLYGIWKLYNHSGTFYTVFDYEKSYQFTWEDVLQFITKENIDLEEPGTYIIRVNTPVDGKYWYISWNTKDYSKNRPFKEVHLDGDNGKIIAESYYEMEY